jgi:hypothetical protein
VVINDPSALLHILPQLCTELLYMETLLSKKMQLQTTVDITNEKSQDELKEAERKLDGLIGRAGQNAQDVITRIYPQSNASVGSIFLLDGLMRCT